MEFEVASVKVAALKRVEEVVEELTKKVGWVEA